MADRKVALMKILQSKYLEAFLDGKIYMNPPVYFSTLEAADTVRSDSDEGIHASLQLKEISIANDEGIYIPIDGLINPVIHRTEDAADYNMFCMYTITEGSTEPVDRKNLAFGDKSVVIMNALEFLKRFKSAVEKIGRKTSYGMINYVDRDTYHGPMGPFRKFSSFSYQNEYRMALRGGNGKPCTIEIGSIRDICAVVSSVEINQWLLRE